MAAATLAVAGAGCCFCCCLGFLPMHPAHLKSLSPAASQGPASRRPAGVLQAVSALNQFTAVIITMPTIPDVKLADQRAVNHSRWLPGASPWHRPQG